jgi:hypothetical protein
MIIGQIAGGKKLEIDLPTLVDTRLLIQVNSGDGKSWLLRLVAERAGIQTIVLDNEGSLRACAKQLPCYWWMPTEICRPIHAMRRSWPDDYWSTTFPAVVDLYELKLPERRRFVKLFL